VRFLAVALVLLFALAMPLRLEAVNNQAPDEKSKIGFNPFDPEEGAAHCAPKDCGPTKHWFVLGACFDGDIGVIDRRSTMISDDGVAFDAYQWWRFPATVVITHAVAEMNQPTGSDAAVFEMSSFSIDPTHGSFIQHAISGTVDTNDVWTGAYWVEAGSNWTVLWDYPDAGNAALHPCVSYSGYIMAPGGVDDIRGSAQRRPGLFMMGGVDLTGYTGDFWQSPGFAANADAASKRLRIWRSLRIWRTFVQLEGAPGSGFNFQVPEMFVSSVLTGDTCTINTVVIDEANCWIYGPWDNAFLGQLGVFVDETFAFPSEAVSHSMLASFQTDIDATFLFANITNNSKKDFGHGFFTQTTIKDCASNAKGMFPAPEDLHVSALHVWTGQDPGTSGDGYDITLYVDGSSTSCTCTINDVPLFGCAVNCDEDVDQGAKMCMLWEEVGSSATLTGLRISLEIQRR
jgi:hypothetical protein